MRSPVRGTVLLHLLQVGGLGGRSRVPRAQALLAKFRCWDIEGTRVIKGCCVTFQLPLTSPEQSHATREGGRRRR